MASSLKDVALRAGVSVRTVSNVVHDAPYVAPATRARVQAVLAELEGRLGDTRERLTEGADVTVQLGALQTELAMVERELLLTTGYPLRAHVETDMAAWIADLDEHGLAGVAIKLARYVDELPAEALAMLEALGRA